MEKKDIKIGIIGLGYVGLPLAVQFSKQYSVIGFDTNKKRISELLKGVDRTHELSNDQLSISDKLKFSDYEEDLESLNTYIVTVPTPVDKNNAPDLEPLKMASKIVGRKLKKGDYVIFESTVFPGCTEEVCVPILASESGLKYNIDFYCGYSPERINPGDKKHKLPDIIKITSGSNDLAANYIDELYKSIIKAGTFKASSIAVAEAAKVIENTQRDVNIGLINELSIIFSKLNIETKEVIEAASTKWNFSSFTPGLVGGHCIGVDPYYLTYKALETGYHPQIITAGRRINDGMPSFIVENTVSQLSRQGISLNGAKVGVLGLSFKENCPDLRNTKVVDIVDKLKKYKCKLLISDYIANRKEAMKLYGIDLVDLKKIKNQDALIIAVSHDQYKNFLSNDWSSFLNPGGVVIDLKSIYPKGALSDFGLVHWRL